VLVITRRAGERICLGDQITVTVLEVSGSSVRLGIDAPGDVPVYRIKEENAAAALAPASSVPTDIPPN
jgi:carbon storage regulator